MTEITVPVADLQIGYYIKLPMSWKHHPFLLNSFCIKDSDQLAQLRTLGLGEFTVIPEKSKVAVITTKPVPPIEPETPPPSPDVTASKEQQHQLRRALRHAEKSYTESAMLLKEAFSQLGSKPDTSLATIGTLVRTLAEQLLQDESSHGLQCVRASPQSDPLILHSLDMTILAMSMAKELGWSRLDIEDTGVAALLHDIGELRIPHQILHKRTELTKAELSYMHMHPQYGFELLTSLNAYTPKIRNAILQHHEWLDGSGYPKKLTAHSLDPLSRLLAVADFVDELLHPRNTLQAANPNQVLFRLYKKSGKQLDAAFSQLLIKLMGIYPPGSFIKLSDESIGLVTSSHPLHPRQPVILPYIRGQRPETAELLDLQTDERQIVCAIDGHELSNTQKAFFSLEHHYCFYFSSSSGIAESGHIPAM
jgi:uncharacterized domain HDIG